LAGEEVRDKTTDGERRDTVTVIHYVVRNKKLVRKFTDVRGGIWYSEGELLFFDTYGRLRHVKPIDVFSIVDSTDPDLYRLKRTFGAL
jgi:hypothetical protein